MKKIAKQLIIIYFIVGITGCVAGNPQQKPSQIELIPMYGGQEKTEQQIQADNNFIQSITNGGDSRETGSAHVAALGWKYYWEGDLETAMKRFNQAWLLDPGNSESYLGFAIISADRNHPRIEVENMFKTAISKPNAGASTYVDYGRYLCKQSDFDKSIVLYQKALDLFPAAYNARSGLSFVYYRKGDYESACYWAKLAMKNNDELEPGYLEAMCSIQSD